MGQHRPSTTVERAAVGGSGVAHPQRNRREHRLLGRLHAVRAGADMGVSDHLHLALAVQQHLASAVTGNRLEALHFQHLAQRLRPGGGVFDELDAGQAERVGTSPKASRSRLGVPVMS